MNQNPDRSSPFNSNPNQGYSHLRASQENHQRSYPQDNRTPYQEPQRSFQESPNSPTSAPNSARNDNSSTPPTSTPSVTPVGERKLVPIQGGGIQGVQLVQGTNAMVSQV